MIAEGSAVSEIKAEPVRLIQTEEDSERGYTEAVETSSEDESAMSEIVPVATSDLSEEDIAELEEMNDFKRLFEMKKASGELLRKAGMVQSITDNQYELSDAELLSMAKEAAYSALKRSKESSEENRPKKKKKVKSENVSAEKAKEQIKLSKFVHSSDLAKGYKIEHIVDRFFKSPSNLLNGEVLAVSPLLSKAVAEKLKVKKIERPSENQDYVRLATTVKNPGSFGSPVMNASVRSVPTGKYPVKIDGHYVEALFDSGCTLNLLNGNIARYLKLRVKPYNGSITVANGVTESVEFCTDEYPIEIEGVKVYTKICITDALTEPLLLGRPFEHVGRLKWDNQNDGAL